MRFRFIEQHARTFPVRLMCRVLQVSPALIGSARVSVPVVTISPPASGGLTASFASTSTR